MKLSWIHNQEAGMLTCTIHENLQYTTVNGGASIRKIYNGDTHDIESNQEWEQEKHWLSDNHSDMVGIYRPNTNMSHEEWMLKNPTWTKATPLFGLSSNGEYLDKLQRPASVQEGREMSTVYISDKIRIERDSNGDYWQRPFCEERDEFYNVQPCCVFPYNPGRTKMDTEEAERVIQGGANE